MSDIAFKAGVSRTAVSAVLNGGSLENVRLAVETRQRILQAAEELGYRRNQLARAVALGKTGMIGYLVDEPRYEPYGKIMVGCSRSRRGAWLYAQAALGQRAHPRRARAPMHGVTTKRFGCARCW
jgi:DNA-binding LacI/PurR family transcriptional regulator